MDNFFKSVKDNLENREEPDFNPAAWKNLQSKMALDATPVVSDNTNNVISKWTTLLALLLIGSIGLNSWLYINSNNKITNYSNSILTHQIDTILQTEVIYKSDTIYQTKYVQNKIATNQELTPIHHNKSDNNNNFSFFRALFANPIARNHTLLEHSIHMNNTTLANMGKNTALVTPIGLQFFDSKRNNNVDLISKNSITTNKYFQSVLTPIPTRQQGAITPPIKSLELEYIASQLKKRSFAQMIYPMRPKSFKIGITGGLIRPLVTGDDQNSNLKFIGGIEPSIVFSENLELFAEASYFTMQIEYEMMDENIGIPLLDPMIDDAEFEEANLSQNIYQFGVGMKYSFLTNGNFHPYIGVGFYGLKISKYQVDYTFEIEDNQGGGQTEDEDITIPRNFSTSGIINNQLVLRGGLEYELPNNWSIQLDGFYRQKINMTTLITPNNIGLRTGIYKYF